MQRAILVWGVVLGLAGCGGSATDSGQSQFSGAELVQAYCRYGSVSSAQLQGCIERVTPEAVLGYKTNAARYAEGDLRGCLGDSGPYCR